MSNRGSYVMSNLGEFRRRMSLNPLDWNFDFSCTVLFGLKSYNHCGFVQANNPFHIPTFINRYDPERPKIVVERQLVKEGYIVD